LRAVIKRTLRRFGYELVNTRARYFEDGIYSIHSNTFRRSPRFRAAYARGVQASAGLDPRFEWRVHVALWAASNAARLSGDFVECGVNAGFISSAMMQYLDWDRLGKCFYLVDTFAGPIPDQYSPEEIACGRAEIAANALVAGAYVTDIESVRRNFSSWRNVRIVLGAVPGVLPEVDANTVAFLHLDMNCAYPERAALEFFWERMPRGGMVLLDDYCYAGCEEQGRAIQASAERFGAEVLSLPTGQGLIVR
jgi:hypothetical protein